MNRIGYALYPSKSHPKGKSVRLDLSEESEIKETSLLCCATMKNENFVYVSKKFNVNLANA